MPPNHLDNSHCYAVEEEGGEEEDVMVVAYIDLSQSVPVVITTMFSGIQQQS
jgi:hypothetical protein